jgi:hypothetical protein
MNLLLLVSSSDLGYTRCNVVSPDESLVNQGDYAK